MPIYCVSYDLLAKNGEERDYQPIWDAIGTFDNFQALYSLFLVDAPSKDAVKQVIEVALRKGDRFFIDRIRPNEHSYRAMPGINDWLAAHPPV